MHAATTTAPPPFCWPPSPPASRHACLLGSNCGTAVDSYPAAAHSSSCRLLGEALERGDDEDAEERAFFLAGEIGEAGRSRVSRRNAVGALLVRRRCEMGDKPSSAALAVAAAPSASGCSNSASAWASTFLRSSR